MIANSPGCRVLLISVFLAATAVLHAAQENATLKGNSIKFEKAQLPGGIKDGETPELKKDWWRIEVQYNTQEDMTGEVRVKFFIDGEDQLNPGQPVVLTGEETYINVPKGNGHIAGMYLHPTTLLRFGGKQGASGFNKSNVHVDLYEAGRLVDGQDMKKDNPNWQASVQQVGGMLLSVAKTPFWPDEAMRYEQVKSDSRP